MAATASEVAGLTPDAESALRVLLARGPARVWGPREWHGCGGATHSRLSDGRQLCWPADSAPAFCRVAVDAELVEQRVPSQLARRAGALAGEAFWRLWTRAEVRAKLRDVPILEWLRRVDWAADGDLPGAGEPLALATHVEGERVVSYGLVVGEAKARHP